MGQKRKTNKQPRSGNDHHGGGGEGIPGHEHYSNDEGYQPGPEGSYYEAAAADQPYQIDQAVPRSYQDGDDSGLTSDMAGMHIRSPTVNAGYYGNHVQGLHQNYLPHGCSGFDTQAEPSGVQMNHSAYMQQSDPSQYPEDYYSTRDKGKQPIEASSIHNPAGDYPTYHSNTTGQYGAIDGYNDPSSSIPGAEDETNEEHAYRMAMRESEKSAIWGASQPSDAGGPSTYAPAEEEPEAMPESSSLHPDPTPPSSFMITEENDFVFDSRYKKEHSKKYLPGAVFKTLWAEPHGQAPTMDHPISEVASVRNNIKNFYIGIRRFIVVANDKGHSSCVPILTYDQRGCRKPGIDPLQHGIIHTKGTQPIQLQGEPNMGFAPVALDMSVREKLAPQSRVNYSKIVTVEHVTKVYFIGRIKKDDFKTVQHAVDSCWLNKNHGTYY